MHSGLARPLLICLTILGLLLPRISAAVALATPGADLVVICTGHGLQTLRLDPDGAPLPVGETRSDLCLLVHAADTAARAVLPPVRVEPAEPAPWARSAFAPFPFQSLSPPSRAPPAA